MYKISKEFHFEAAHMLIGMPEGHQCGRMHGHSYVVVAHLSSYDLDPTGFVEDYGELKDIKQYIDDELDHRVLNDVLPIEQTSAENIAKFLYDKFSLAHPHLYAIEVRETAKSSCIYTTED